MSLRVKTVRWLLDVIEKQFFYRKLAAFYKTIGLPEHAVILDVGANRGQSIDFFISLFPNATIFAFEPNPVLFAILVQKFAELPNITLINKGVSAQNGTLILKEMWMDETSTFETLNYESDYLKTKSRILGFTPETLVAKSYNVDVIKLSDFIADRNLDHIDVIKIDTEGHEIECLRGLFPIKNVRIDYLQIEAHGTDIYKKTETDVLPANYLRQHGFSPFHKIKHSFGNFHELFFKSITPF